MEQEQLQQFEQEQQQLNFKPVNKYNYLFTLLIFLLILSCENSIKTKSNNSKDVSSSDLSTQQKDSTSIKSPDQSLDSLTSTKKLLKTADYIIQYPANKKSGITSHMEHLIQAWQNVPNPITATYIGNDFGDYHHIHFKDANGVEYDFGQANNNFGEYKLFENSGQYEDHPGYLGKEFKVYWDWTLSEFLCCDGEYGKAKAYLPAITKLELIKD